MVTSVLIVEDEDALAEPLAFLLRKEGFDVRIAGDGPTALAEFEVNPVDIVLLDTTIGVYTLANLVMNFSESPLFC